MWLLPRLRPARPTALTPCPGWTPAILSITDGFLLTADFRLKLEFPTLPVKGRRERDRPLLLKADEGHSAVLSGVRTGDWYLGKRSLHWTQH